MPKTIVDSGTTRSVRKRKGQGKERVGGGINLKVVRGDWDCRGKNKDRISK